MGVEETNCVLDEGLAIDWCKLGLLIFMICEFGGNGYGDVLWKGELCILVEWFVFVMGGGGSRRIRGKVEDNLIL